MTGIGEGYVLRVEPLEEFHIRHGASDADYGDLTTNRWARQLRQNLNRWSPQSGDYVVYSEAAVAGVVPDIFVHAVAAFGIARDGDQRTLVYSILGLRVGQSKDMEQEVLDTIYAESEEFAREHGCNTISTLPSPSDLGVRLASQHGFVFDVERELWVKYL
ncbi:MAG TPA: hypothetical protein VK988_17685 [Acidimicrobiales bacterium]|nr:hypothetical protein [Acidimicrobiales bacterium]